MYHRFLTVVLCFCLKLHAQVDTFPILQQTLSQAQPWSYVVLHQGQTYTFLYVKPSPKPGEIWLEEIHIPVSLFSRQSLSWQEWFLKHAPHHSGWNLLPISLSDFSCNRFYSFTQQAWITLSSSSNILTTLLCLEFQEIPITERKKIGPMPGRGKQDHRPIWTPLVCWEGQKISGIPFRAYTAYWPQDQTDLAGRRIEIYLPEEASPYQIFFPYWMEIEGRIGQAKFRVIESGVLSRQKNS